MHLSEKQLSTLKQKLEEQRIKLRDVLSSLEKTDPARDPDRANENADTGDDATEDRELVRHESLLSETGVMLTRVEEALSRIEEGNYGHTLEGQPIPYKRLLIDPSVTTLVS